VKRGEASRPPVGSLFVIAARLFPAVELCIIVRMQTLLVEAFGPLVGAFFLLAIVLGIRRWRAMRQTPEDRQAEREAFRRRLIEPQTAQVEREMGGLVPQRLIELYADHRTVLAEELEISRPGSGKTSSEWIEGFLPLDLESQKLSVDLREQGWGKGFCFATDGAGNFYWVPLSETRQADGPVFFACHDPYGNEQVAASLEEFLSWPRKVHSPESAQRA
jgi:SMI1 / KNR4 family (SUKH-1)